MSPTNDFLARLYNNQPESRTLPSKTKAHHFADEMIALLFPIRTEITPSLQQMELSLYHLKLELLEYLYPLSDRLKASPQTIVEDFFDRIPEIYDELIDDAKTIERFDPAAASVEEVIVAYPGFYAIAIHRLAHLLVTLGVPTLPRMISEYAHTQTGIDIHPGAKIGKSFFIDHGTGIVIGETTVIGNSVKVYQGVTLGALSVRKDHANTKRHPTIEDNVIIYSGSTILGGETIIGHDSIIGGNVWLTESVLPYSIVYHKSEVHVRNEKYLNVAQDFMI